MHIGVVKKKISEAYRIKHSFYKQVGNMCKQSLSTDSCNHEKLNPIKIVLYTCADSYTHRCHKLRSVFLK